MSNNREPSAMDVVKFYRGKLEGKNSPKRFTIATADFEILAKAAEDLHNGFVTVRVDNPARLEPEDFDL